MVANGSAAAVSATHVSFRHKGASAGYALDDLELEVPAGEVVVLCGRSGCGKTTVTRLLNGLIPQFYEGDLWGRADVLGVDPSVEPITRLATLVGSVFQNPRSQFFNVDTTSELAFGCENMGWAPTLIDAAMAGVVVRFGLGLLDRNLFKLSGAKAEDRLRERVITPRLLVLDEPASNLDVASIRMLASIVAQWKAEGRTVVVAEHRLGYLLDVADRFVLVEDGRVAWEKTASEMAALSEGELHAAGLRSVRPVRFERAPAGCGGASAAHDEPAGLEVRSLRFGYEKAACRTWTWRGSRFRAGHRGVLGDNGAGKSTFARCLCGLEKRARGEGVRDGHACSNAQRRRLCYLVLQDVHHQLFSESVREEVALSLRNRAEGPLRGEAAESEIEAVLAGLGLTDLVDRHPMALSGGQKQRVAIASAVASGREVCVFDEPTSGLDWAHMLDTANNLHGLAARGVTSLVITHDPELVAACCDHVLFVEGGRASWWGRLDDAQVAKRVGRVRLSAGRFRVGSRSRRAVARRAPMRAMRRRSPRTRGLPLQQQRVHDDDDGAACARRAHDGLGCRSWPARWRQVEPSDPCSADGGHHALRDGQQVGQCGDVVAHERDIGGIDGDVAAAPPWRAPSALRAGASLMPSPPCTGAPSRRGSWRPAVLGRQSASTSTMPAWARVRAAWAWSPVAAPARRQRADAARRFGRGRTVSARR
ncbi:MAG: ABC transporter ATP-binding protein [Eggerthella lenta]